MDTTLLEIVTRRKIYSAGSIVTNCVIHMHLPITERPEDCRLCHADMGNFISRAVRVNEFLNKILDDIESRLGEQLQMEQAK